MALVCIVINSFPGSFLTAATAYNHDGFHIMWDNL
jgi:hypothetical protein